MDVATGAMGSLLPKLADLRLEEYNLPKGVKEDIEYLSSEMMMFEAALLEIADVPRDQLDRQLRIWAEDARELSYGIEDVVDSFVVGPQGFKPANLDDFKSRMKKVANMFKNGKRQTRFADAIKGFKIRAREAVHRRRRYGYEYGFANSETRVTVDPRLVAIYRDPKEIVGIEDSTRDLIKKLLYDDDHSSRKQLKMVSIFGSVGLGKTTLAKAVYDKIKTNFDCGAFLSVGRNPDVKKTLKDLLFQVSTDRYKDFSTLDVRELIDTLRMQLGHKRYLIVLDDIWDVQAWEIIKIALVDNDCGSSVIRTTRIFDVAQIGREVYKLKPLSHEKSKELFCGRLFGGIDKIPNQLAEVTESIIKKCGGIPLAIITMTSLLVRKPWETWSVVYHSIGFGHGDDEAVQTTRKISLFSYYDLPRPLRTCLLHLSIFSEGHMIRKDTLIWKWITEDFIHERQGLWGLFEVGESYFYELINRSLVEPVEIPCSGIVIGCRVNVLVLDMICFMSKEENFVTLLDSHKENTSDRPDIVDSHERDTSDGPEVLDSHEGDTSDRRQARRLAIQNRVVEQNEMLANPRVQPASVRSFNATNCEIQMMPSLTSFQLLRVLALEDCASIGGICHLEHIRKLVHLRYLGLFNTPICELPEGIRNLQFLQTLDLRQTKIEELPHGIVLLRQLKCLRAGSRSITVPAGMGNLESLEELQLSDVSSTPNIVNELGKLRELRDLKLCIRLSDESSNRDLVESLGSLQKIEILHLDGELWIEKSYWKDYISFRGLRHLFLGMKFSRLPAWINPSLLPMLSHLSVDLSVVEEEDLLILGSFHGLLSLSLVGEYVCLPDTMGDGAFPGLKYCYTSGMASFLKGTAPILESVSFNVRLWGSKDGSFDLEFRSLLDHPLLQEVRVEIFYTEAHLMEVDEVEAALRRVVHFHPNNPILDISKWKSSVYEQFDSHYDVDGNDYYDDNEEDSDHEYYYDEE